MRPHGGYVDAGAGGGCQGVGASLAGGNVEQFGGYPVDLGFLLKLQFGPAVHLALGMGQHVVGQLGGAPQFEALAVILTDYGNVIGGFQRPVNGQRGPVLKLQVLHPGGESCQFRPLAFVKFGFHTEQRIYLLAVL